MTPSSFVIVLTTFPANEDTGGLARTLVSERLAACVNALPPMSSTYRWEGTVEFAREQQLVIKTTRSCVDRLKTRLKELHPYDVPEILVLPVVEGGEAYLKWLEASVD